MSLLKSVFQPDSFIVADVAPSPNFDARKDNRAPNMILLHYTGMQTGEAALQQLTAAQSKVSAHYVVFEDGRIVQCVREEWRAWHAGEASWAGETDINSCSIGIEIHNPGHDFDYPDFTEAEMQALEALCRDILSRHAIPPQRVLAHSDVAPGRKRDPGEKFDWARLARAGIGLWVPPAPLQGDAGLGPGDEGESVAALQRALRDYGYGVEVTTTYGTGLENAVEAFQRHFRPARIDGRADASTSDTLQRLLIARSQAAMA
jgi:N-acetylmuramoyl-L-alanine amidase